MFEKIKTNVDRLLLVLKFKKSSILAKYMRFSFIAKTKSSLSTSVFIFFTFLKLWKQRFMYFGHKHVETGPNYSYKLATFLNYHMPLKKVAVKFSTNLKLSHI